MSFLLIDNYDSFTYNLFHYLGELGAEVDVVRNDALSAETLWPYRINALEKGDSLYYLTVRLNY